MTTIEQRDQGDVDAWMGTAEEVLAAIEAAWTAP